ncbi:hypothetical protein ACIRP7_36410 [Streptomyces sp. NPDC102270]|uniref:hypothetical protein n=1 Tax=Streptomyces sp. NPDC102270 TaxID=3366150 RepID=UPI0037F3118F
MNTVIGAAVDHMPGIVIGPDVASRITGGGYGIAGVCQVVVIPRHGYLLLGVERQPIP